MEMSERGFGKINGINRIMNVSNSSGIYAGFIRAREYANDNV
jgi:hypothetical protein